MQFLLILPFSPLAKILIYFPVLIGFMILGRWYRHYRVSKFPEEHEIRFGIGENSLIGLSALLLAFTFSMTASRFEKRRDSIVDESVAIRTAIFRIDLYPDSIRKPLLKEFDHYIDERIAYYDAGEDIGKIDASHNEAMETFARIWKGATLAQSRADLASFIGITNALSMVNELLIKRNASRSFVTPRVMLAVLVAMMLLSGFIAGYNSEGKRINFVLVLCFAVMTSMALFLIFELDSPRSGLINLDDAAKHIRDLKKII